MEIDYLNLDKNIKIIDIRTKEEYKEYHLPNSMNIPRLLLLKNYSNYIDKENKYYVICNKGEVSASCCKILNALGYNLISIKDGIDSIKK